MATYTITLGELIESQYPINLYGYPIFEEGHRKTLNDKIINHYYFREIGSETADRFNFYLGRKLNEIMPYYNELFRSLCFQYDPLSSEYFTYVENEKNISNKEQENKNIEILCNRIENTLAGFNANTSEETQKETALKTINDKQSYTKNGEKEGGEKEDNTKTRTDNLKEVSEQSTKSNSTSEGNQETNSENHDTSHGHNLTNGYKSSVFADVAQAPFDMKTVVDPDGTVHTDIEGYATTVSRDSTYENNTTDTNTDGSAKTTGNSSNTTDQNISVDTTKDNTGTQTYVEDIDKKFNETNTEKGGEERNETENNSLENKNNFNGTIKTDEQETQLKKENRVENIVTNDKEKNNKDRTFTFKGRKGYSPNTLVKEFRENLLNIDMMIINELEILFMGVF